MSYYCSVCNEEITKKENDYSYKKLKRPLCRTHQIDTNGQKSPNLETPINKSKNDRVNQWVENVIKGRIAETIVEELFKELGFQVYKYGMENSIPGIAELLRGVKDEVAMSIKKMPDFVIFKDKKAHFLEVKFKKDEKYTIDHIDKNGDYPFHNALILVVSKKHIKCISYQELADGKEITPKCRNYLGNRKEFDTDRDTIIEYCKYALQFFETVD
ncbi:MAG: hypothetical protein RIG77_00745 [Cyclobacteriaceae bacterium]